MKRTTRPVHTYVPAAIALAGFVTLSGLSVPARVAAFDNYTITERTRSVALETPSSGSSFSSAALSEQTAASGGQASTTQQSFYAMAGTALVSPGAIKTVKRPPPAPAPVVVTPEPVRLAVATPAPAPAPKPAAKPAPKPAPAPAEPTDDGKTELPPASGIEGFDPNSIKISWGGSYKSTSFGDGYCTEHAAAKRGGVRWLGHAYQWPAGAKAAGVPTGKYPVPGSILVTSESGYGHVAYVESVNWENKTFTVSEQNFKGWGVTSYRTLPFNFSRIVTFIY